MNKSIYNLIARDYDLKRKAPWKAFESFLNSISNQFRGITIDLGCGNGRNFKILKNQDNKIVGIDNSIDLLEIASQTLKDNNEVSNKMTNNIDILLGDINQLPIRPNSINTIFSIASLHHVKNKSIRKNTIRQLYDILMNDGYLLLTVWRRWQKKYRYFFIIDKSKRIIYPKYRKKQKMKDLKEFGDKLVPWTISSEKMTYYRFYHFFSKREIKKLLKRFKMVELEVTGGPTNSDNFFILSQK